MAEDNSVDISLNINYPPKNDGVYKVNMHILNIVFLIAL